MNFQKRVELYLMAARKKHKPMNSPHEGLAVLWEEFEEFKEEVFRQKFNRRDALDELVSVAAMCRRLAEDCKLLDDEDLEV